MATSNNRFISVSPVVQKLILTSGAVVSAQLLSSQLCAAAESLYLARDYDSLSQVADVLSGLPSSEAQAASLFYRAVIERSNGREESAARLLEGVLSTKAAPRFHGRALQTLGIIHRVAGDRREAARLYALAIECATGPRVDLLTLVNATLTRSELRSSEGDHERALDELRAVRPAVELVAQVHPVYSPLFANDIAYELLQSGRVDEARRFAAFALASPLASRFPAWADTAQEIEQQAEALAVQNRIVRVEARPARASARKRTSRTLFLVQKIVLSAPARRWLSRTEVFRHPIPDCLTTSALVAICSPIRAPSPMPTL